MIPTVIGEDLGLSRAFPAFRLAGDELYLSAHPDLKRNLRIRLIWDHLLEALKAKFS